MKTNLSVITPNLSNHSDNSQSRAFSLKRLLLCTLAWCGLVIITAAIAIAQAAPAQSVQRNDGLIETDVVQALNSSYSLKNQQITAATIQGEVTLTGNVSSEASRELAEILVSRVSGVTHVQNNLQVNAPLMPQDAQTVPQTQLAQPQVQPQPEEAAQVEQPQQPLPPPQPQAPAQPQPTSATSEPADPSQAPYPSIPPPPPPTASGCRRCTRPCGRMSAARPIKTTSTRT